jgi:protein O-mannosyl-transferase
MPSPRDILLTSIVLLGIVFVFYGKTINYDYVLDDQIVITKNQYTTQGVSGIYDLLTHETFEGYFKEKKILVEGGRYRPLSLVTFAMEWSLFAMDKADKNGRPMLAQDGKTISEGNPHISHLINILLYAFTGLMIYILLFQLFPPNSKKPWFWNIPFIGAVIFILHPVHIEAVANIKGRDEIMALLGSLAALYYSLRSVKEQVPSKKLMFQIAAGICFFLGLLSKENTITFLAIIPLTVYFFTQARKAEILKATVPAVIATVFYILLRFKAVGLISPAGEITDLMNNPFYGMTGLERVSTIFYTLGLYLKLLFFPHPLTSDYMPYHILILNWTDYRAFVPFIFYIVLAIIALIGFRKKSILSYCILFFFITLSITSNLFFSVGSFMNERFIYMSSLSFCILVAWFVIVGLYSWKGTANRVPVITGMLILLLFLTGFSFKTWSRVPDWKDQLSIDRSAFKVSKNSARANCYMGIALFEKVYLPRMKVLKEAAGKQDIRVSKADTVQLLNLLDTIDLNITNALKIYPEYGSAIVLRSGIAAEYYKFGKYDMGKLLGVYSSLIHTRKDLPFILENTAYLNRKVIARMKTQGNETLRYEASMDAERLKAFYLQTFDFYSDTVRDYKKSLGYLKLAEQLAPADPAVKERLKLMK